MYIRYHANVSSKFFTLHVLATPRSSLDIVMREKLVQADVNMIKYIVIANVVVVFA